MESKKNKEFTCTPLSYSWICPRTKVHVLNTSHSTFVVLTGVLTLYCPPFLLFKLDRTSAVYLALFRRYGSIPVNKFSEHSSQSFNPKGERGHVE